MQPTSYDPTSDNETSAPSLPNSPLEIISPYCSVQPPLSRRGAGPGLIVLLPSPEDIEPSSHRPLDPEPVQKWAEEGFAVAAVTPDTSVDVLTQVKEAAAALRELETADGDTFGLIVYRADVEFLDIPDVCCIITFDTAINTSLPTYTHLSSDAVSVQAEANVKSSKYDAKKNFVLPYSKSYNSGAAALSHTRSLVFLRNHLGGPHFDLEAIWDEHTYWEFERRSVAQTMATMVVSLLVSAAILILTTSGRTIRQSCSYCISVLCLRDV